MTLRSESTPQERARRRANEYAGMLWHVAAFVVVNSFLWVLDFITGGGLDWAYWATIPWSVGLAMHYMAYVVSERGIARRSYERFLAEELQRERQAEELQRL